MLIINENDLLLLFGTSGGRHGFDGDSEAVEAYRGSYRPR